MARILVVDNRDSFVHNLVQYLRQLGADCAVRGNGSADSPDAFHAPDASGFDGVLISPGPGAPERAGISVPLVRHCARTGTPLLGVCLGHQAIAVAFGATVGRAPEPFHGRTSEVEHDGSGVFAGLPDPLTATRYHSLAVQPDTVPAALRISARTRSGVIMGLRHRELPIEGVQFHPESVLTQRGHQLLGNWLESGGDVGAAARARGLAPLIGAKANGRGRATR